MTAATRQAEATELIQANEGARRPGKNDLREVLTVALAHHRAGRLADAAQIYERVLAADPRQPDALHLLGLIALAEGRHADAVNLLVNAVAAAPRMAPFHNALGNAQQAMGDLAAATASYRRAADLDPKRAEFATNLAAVLVDQGDLAGAEAALLQALDADRHFPNAYFVLGSLLRARGDNEGAADAFQRALAAEALVAPALFNLGNSLRDLGRLDEAEAAYRRLLALEPAAPAETAAQAWLALGRMLQEAGRLAEADACFRALVEARPDHGEGWFYRGVVAHARGAMHPALEAYRRALAAGLDTAALRTNLGLVLEQLGRAAEAVEHQRRAVALAPDAPDLRLNLATALRAAGDLPGAADACRAALRQAPDLAAAHSLLGSILVQQGRRAEAVAAHTRARQLAPDSPAVLNEYANALMDDGAIAPAIAAYRDAIARAPESAPLHFNLGRALLAAGELDEGWAEYAWRWRLDDMSLAWEPPCPRWAGEPLAGKTLLVWREQGIGDELMFASCLPDLAATGARLIIACTARLVPLFTRSFPNATVVAESELATARRFGADYHIPVGDLPRWLRRTPDAFPARRGYLVADPVRVACWRERLEALRPGLTVGVCWRSGLLTPSRRTSYAPLGTWAVLFRTPGVRFVNLQYDDCIDDLVMLERDLGATVYRWPGVDLTNDLDDAAGLIAALDLVISAPTAVGELAGALGAPVWRVTGGRDWTMLGTTSRPWFPSMKVFARRPGETWRDLLTGIAEALTALAARTVEAR